MTTSSERAGPVGDGAGPGDGAEPGTPGRFRLAVEFDPGTVPIAGRVVPSSGEPLDFAGYVGLIAALESLRPPRTGEGAATSES